MKKIRFLLLPALLCASFAASAIVPALAYWLASTNMSLSAGLVLDYFYRDVKVTPASQPIRVFIKLNDDAPEDNLIAPSGAASETPALTVARSSTGGTMTVQYPETSTNGYTSTKWHAFTGTAAQFIDTLKYLPTPPFNYSAIGRPFSGAENTAWTVTQRYTTAPLSMYVTKYCSVGGCGVDSQQVSNTHYVELTPGSSTASMRFPVHGATFSNCPAGYSPTPDAPSSCYLTDAEQVRQSGSLRDGKCVVTASGPNPFDPDCAALNTGISRETTSDGTPVYLVKDPSGVAPEVTSISRNADNTKQVSQSQRGVDGNGSLQTVKVTPTGRVGEVSGTNYQGSPSPQYPGQSAGGTGGTGGTGGNGGTGGSSTVGAGCGNEGQPRCAVEIDTGDPSEGVGDEMPSGLSDAFSGLTSNTLAASAHCPADIFSFNMPLPASVGGPMFVSDSGVFCDAMTQYQDLFRTVSIAASLIAAMFIVLRA